MNKSARTLALAALPVVALGPSATYRRLDVTSDEDWAAASAEFGGIDVLVLNAGVDAVADRAMRDINRRKLISTPDAAATVAWYGKRFTYPAYLGFTTLAMSYFRRLMVREYPSESGRG